MGFGAKTGIDIEGELQGVAPSQEWKWQRFRQKWFTGDTVSIGLAVGTLSVAGFLAAWIPARRAARVDPMTALRTE